MIQIPVLKIIAYSLIPKLVHDVYVAGKRIYNETHIFSDPPPPKKRDTSPWTQARFDTVMQLRKEWLTYNNRASYNSRDKKRTLSSLTKQINTKLNMNKSQRAIAAIWEGKIKRSTLLPGEKNAQQRKIK